MEADVETGAKRVRPKGEVQDAPGQPTRAKRGRGSAKADSQSQICREQIWTHAVRPQGAGQG